MLVLGKIYIYSSYFGCSVFLLLLQEYLRKLINVVGLWFLAQQLNDNLMFSSREFNEFRLNLLPINDDWYFWSSFLRENPFSANSHNDEKNITKQIFIFYNWMKWLKNVLYLRDLNRSNNLARENLNCTSHGWKYTKKSWINQI